MGSWLPAPYHCAHFGLLAEGVVRLGLGIGAALDGVAHVVEAQVVVVGAVAGAVVVVEDVVAEIVGQHVHARVADAAVRQQVVVQRHEAPAHAHAGHGVHALLVGRLGGRAVDVGPLQRGGLALFGAVGVEYLVVGVGNVAVVGNDVHRTQVEGVGLLAQGAAQVAGALGFAHPNAQVAQYHVVGLYFNAPVLNLHALAGRALAGNGEVGIAHFQHVLQLDVARHGEHHVRGPSASTASRSVPWITGSGGSDGNAGSSGTPSSGWATPMAST